MPAIRRSKWRGCCCHAAPIRMRAFSGPVRTPLPRSRARSDGARIGRINRPIRSATRSRALLLDAGADPNDSQVLYNRHFKDNDDHLKPCSSNTAWDRRRTGRG